jgi:hypothetical protein
VLIEVPGELLLCVVSHGCLHTLDAGGTPALRIRRVYRVTCTCSSESYQIVVDKKVDGA